MSCKLPPEIVIVFVASDIVPEPDNVIPPGFVFAMGFKVMAETLVLALCDLW